MALEIGSIARKISPAPDRLDTKAGGEAFREMRYSGTPLDTQNDCIDAATCPNNNRGRYQYPTTASIRLSVCVSLAQ